MRRGISLVIGAGMLLAASNAFAQSDQAPWNVSKVSKLSRARPAQGTAQPNGEPLKYLHVEVKFPPASASPKMHKFRVVDQRGKAVGELWGFNEDRSLLIFERDEVWPTLVGLYLEGLDHKEPLFATQKAPAQVDVVPPTTVRPTVIQPPTQPPVVQPRVTDPVIVDRPRTTYVPPADRVVVRDVPDRVVVHDGPDRVLHTGPDRVIHEGTSRVIHEGTDRVIHHGTGSDRVVHHYHGGDRVVHEGTDRVVHEGTDRVVHEGGDRVVHHDDNRVVHHHHYDSASGAGGDGSGSGGGSAAGAGSGAGGGPGGGSGSGSGSGPAAGAGDALASGEGEEPCPCDDPSMADAVASADSPGLGEGMGPGEGSGPGEGPGMGESPGPGSGEGAGPGEGPAAGTGQTPGEGTGPGMGEGTGPGEAPGEGTAPGEGPSPGEGTAPGEGPGPGMGPGQGEGSAPSESPGQPAPAQTAQGEQPGQGPAPGEPPLPGMVPAAGPGSGPGPGGPGAGSGGPGAGPGNGGAAGFGGGPGGGIGPGYGVVGPDAPGVRFVDPTRPDLRFPQYEDLLVYRDMPWYLREFRPGYGYGNGYGYGGGPGGGGGGGGNVEGYNGPKLPTDMPKIMPEIVLYISCGHDGQPGKVYQVTDAGRVLGIVNLDQTATGLALHRDHGLIAALPKDGGKLVRIDDTGKVSTIMENQEELLHPIDVGVGAESDSIVVADNVADTLMATSTAGNKAYLYHRFDGMKWERQNMSVAVTTDKHVVFGSDGNEGIYRFAGDDYSAEKPPMLPGRGGVAADTTSLKWAATQTPDQVYVFEGEELMTKFEVPPGKGIFRQGLLSFAPGGSVVVAVRDEQETEDQPWLIQYQTAEGKDEVRSLFQWKLDRMVDFVVGPRMYWERNEASDYKSVY